MSVSEVLKSELGVILKRVELRQGAMLIDQQFTVSTKRTPEVKNFPLEQAARDYFAEEVKRCTGD
jgi:hypothetical protein